MAEETVVAASSAAAEAPKFTQFDGWDEDGEPIVSKKTTETQQEQSEDAASAAADASKGTETEDGADSAATKTQEKHRKPGAEARIKELAARAKQLERELEEARKPKKTEAESSTARQTEAKPESDGATRPKPTLNDKDAEGKAKFGSYEEWMEDLADWKAEQKLASYQREIEQTRQRESLGKSLTEARGRYADFDAVTMPLVQELVKPDIPKAVGDVLNDSPVLVDLLYTIGGSEESKAGFLEACRTNPAKALRVALLMEQEIVKELKSAKSGASSQTGTAAASANTKPRAPKPPTEVGGRGTSGDDALLSAAKTGDFRSFDAEQTRRALASRR